MSKKAVVIFLFSFRLVAAVLSIATTVSYFNFLHGTQDSIGLAPTVSWQEALLSSSLVAASIPCLRHFLWAFMSRGLKTMYVFGSGRRGRKLTLSFAAGMASRQRAIQERGQYISDPSTNLQHPGATSRLAAKRRHQEFCRVYDQTG